MSLRPTTARRWRIGVIDGPNMPNLGARDRDLYGPIGSLAELHGFVAGIAGEIGVEVTAFASNFEGEILEFIHGSAAELDAYLINPAGLTTATPSPTRPVPTSRFISPTWRCTWRASRPASA